MKHNATLTGSKNAPSRKREPRLDTEHNQGLLFCWHLRIGFYREIETERLQEYADCFYRQYLTPHFEAEEKEIFGAGAGSKDLVKRALADHRRLRRLFEDRRNVRRSLALIEEKLEEHIRFEEKILFPELERTATPEELARIFAVHARREPGLGKVQDWPDRYWDLE